MMVEVVFFFFSPPRILSCGVELLNFHVSAYLWLHLHLQASAHRRGAVYMPEREWVCLLCGYWPPSICLWLWGLSPRCSVTLTHWSHSHTSDHWLLSLHSLSARLWQVTNEYGSGCLLHLHAHAQKRQRYILSGWETKRLSSAQAAQNNTEGKSQGIRCWLSFVCSNKH